MGAAGGTPAEAAYAAAAAAAADGPTVDDTWYAARASATLDAIKHRQSDNREIVNSIMQVHYCTFPRASVVKRERTDFALILFVALADYMLELSLEHGICAL